MQSEEEKKRKKKQSLVNAMSPIQNGELKSAFPDINIKPSSNNTTNKKGYYENQLDLNFGNQDNIGNRILAAIAGQNTATEGAKDILAQENKNQSKKTKQEKINSQSDAEIFGGSAIKNSTLLRLGSALSKANATQEYGNEANKYYKDILSYSGTLPQNATKEQKRASNIGMVTGQLADTVALSALGAGGGAIESTIKNSTKTGAKKVAEKVLARSADSALENITLDTITKTANALATKQDPKEFVKDLGKNILLDVVSAPIAGATALPFKTVTKSLVDKFGKKELQNAIDVGVKEAAESSKLTDDLIKGATNSADTLPKATDEVLSGVDNTIQANKLTTATEPVNASNSVLTNSIPQQRTRAFYDNVIRNSSPEFSESYSKNADNIYTQITNEETAQKALDSLNLKGEDYAISRLTDKNVLPNAEDTARGEIVLKKLIDTNDISKATYLADNIGRRGTELGQAVQSLSMFSKLTPEGMLVKATQAVTESVPTQKITAVDDAAKKIFDTLSNGKAEDVQGVVDEIFLKGKKVKLPKDKSSEELTQKILTAYNENGNIQSVGNVLRDEIGIPRIDDETANMIIKMSDGLQDLPIKYKNDRLEEIYKVIASKMPNATTREKLMAWRTTAMLGNVKTNARNVVSNTAIIPLNTASDLLSYGGEAFAKKIGKLDKSEATKSVFWRFGKNGKDLSKVVDSEWSNAYQYLKNHGRYNNSMSAISNYKTIFNTKVLEGFRKLSYKALEAGDIPFLKLSFKDNLGQIMSARGLTEANEEVINYAMEKALKATYRQDTKISSAITGLKKTNIGWLLDIALPFQKTPINILQQGFEYSPLAVGKIISEISTGKPLSEVLNTAGKTLTGTALLAAGWKLADMGLASGGYISQKDAIIKNAKGEQDYSITIPGLGSATIDWAQPFALPFFAGVALSDESGKKDIYGKVKNSISSSLDVVFNLSMLQSLSNLFSGKGISELPEQGVLQTIPSIVSQIARTSDNTKRSTYDDTAIGTFAKQLLNRIPYASKFLEPSLNMWGESQSRTVNNTALNSVTQLVSPANLKESDNSKTTQIVMGLYDKIGDIGGYSALPRTPPKKVKVGDTEYTLDDKEYTEFSKSVGQAQKKVVDNYAVRGDTIDEFSYTDANGKRQTLKNVKFNSLNDPTGKYSKEQLQVIFLDKAYNDAYTSAQDKSMNNILKARGIDTKKLSSSSMDILDVDTASKLSSISNVSGISVKPKSAPATISYNGKQYILTNNEYNSYQNGIKKSQQDVANDLINNNGSVISFKVKTKDGSSITIGGNFNELNDYTGTFTKEQLQSKALNKAFLTAYNNDKSSIEQKILTDRKVISASSNSGIYIPNKNSSSSKSYEDKIKEYKIKAKSPEYKEKLKKYKSKSSEYQKILQAYNVKRG